MIKNQSKLGRNVKFSFKDRCNLADCPVIPFVFICFIRNKSVELVDPQGAARWMDGTYTTIKKMGQVNILQHNMLRA